MTRKKERKKERTEMTKKERKKETSGKNRKNFANIERKKCWKMKEVKERIWVMEK